MVTAGFWVGETSGLENAESAAALPPVPALSLHSGWQKHPIAAGLSVFLALPKVMGPAGWARGIWHEVGSWDTFGELFAAI